MPYLIERSDTVSRSAAVEAIQAFVRAEVASDEAEYGGGADFDYDEWWESEVAARHRGTIRRYAEQLGDASLEAMQRAFDELVGSAPFADSRQAHSVARSVVNGTWDGVGQWRG